MSLATKLGNSQIYERIHPRIKIWFHFAGLFGRSTTCELKYVGFLEILPCPSSLLYQKHDDMAFKSEYDKSNAEQAI